SRTRSSPSRKRACSSRAPPRAGSSTTRQRSSSTSRASRRSSADMSSNVDALFSGEPHKKPVDVSARIRRIKRILWFAVPLDLLGIPFWTGVPGAVLTLWAWLATDAEVARIEAGDYAHTDAARLLTVRR